MKTDRPSGTYVDRARDQMQDYVRRLLADNQAFRVCLVELEAEAQRLRQEVSALKRELDSDRDLRAELARKLFEIRNESEQRFAEYAKLETVNANLANLYVASYQLHSTLQRQTVLAAIQEIIVNLIGSEDFGVYECGEDGQVRLAAAIGIEDHDSIASHERVAQATATGQTWVSAQHGDLTACIPLKIEGRVTGFIVIRQLLAHKSGLEPLDLELFDLLATHAAVALYASGVQEHLANQGAVA